MVKIEDEQDEWFCQLLIRVLDSITTRSPVRVKFVPSALNNAIAHILSILYSNQPISNQLRDEKIRERYAAGEGLSDIAESYNISPQRMYQIVHRK